MGILIVIVGAINVLIGSAVMLALMTERMGYLPAFHRIPVGLIAAGLIAEPLIVILGADKMVYPLWLIVEVGIWWLAIVTLVRAWKLNKAL